MNEELREKAVRGLGDAAAYFRSSFDAMDGTLACEIFRGWAEAMEQAIAMLKAQEPRVLTLEEVKTAEVVFLEFQDVITIRIVDTWFGNGDGDIRLVGMDGTRYMAKAAYNDSWRCWTSRPTEEQRKAVKWDD